MIRVVLWYLRYGTTFLWNIHKTKREFLSEQNKLTACRVSHCGGVLALYLKRNTPLTFIIISKRGTHARKRGTRSFGRKMGCDSKFKSIYPIFPPFILSSRDRYTRRQRCCRSGPPELRSKTFSSERILFTSSCIDHSRPRMNETKFGRNARVYKNDVCARSKN